MEFKERLERAVERGRRLGDEQARLQAEQAMGEEELRRLHTQHRLALSEQIEHCLAELQQQFPGFRYESVVGDRGWGAAITRDDLVLERGRRGSHFSRLEMTVRPFSSVHVLELTAKGTICNKEAYNRSHFQRLSELDVATFRELIDLWILEYAELFAARR
jgi:hypothetical protein